MLVLKNLTITVASKAVVKGFTFTFEQDKVYAIMGPNGSGKSSLAHAIMGNPAYECCADLFEFEGKDIREMEPHERARAGIFLAFQTPLALQGVRAQQLLSLVVRDRYDALTLHKRMKEIATRLRISDDVLSRALNEGASGGERKKMEVLQAAILERKLQIFDEIDTGVDVDSLRCIASYLNEHKKGKAYLVITHYNRILRYVKPDVVLILKDGLLVCSGGAELAEEVEHKGYQLL
jgi:Fe-S cluster assembly ATP-binding protein